MSTTYYDTNPLALQATFDSSGNLVDIDVLDILSVGFEPTEVDAFVVAPPGGWWVRRTVWADGSGGNLPVPPPGQETTHPFTYTIAKAGQPNKSGSGIVKLKRLS